MIGIPLERNTGLRKFLTRSVIYEFTQSALNRPSTHLKRLQSHFPGLPSGGLRVLDIGAGPAVFLAQYRSVAEFDYVAIDPSPKYIATAERRYRGEGIFLCGTTASVDGESLGSFDLIIADGVLHHVDDAEALALIRFAKERLLPTGSFVTYDPTVIPGQRRIASLLKRMDRGARIRQPSEYRALLEQAFRPECIQSEIQHDRLRVPYDHFESRSNL